MEPEALTLPAGTTARADSAEIAIRSIAISLKRIADALTGVPYDPAPGADNSRHRMGLVDGVMYAIEQGIIVGVRGTP